MKKMLGFAGFDSTKVSDDPRRATAGRGGEEGAKRACRSKKV